MCHYTVLKLFFFTHWCFYAVYLNMCLLKIQEQLTDIQKQLAEKEARWKETLLKEIGSLQVKLFEYASG